MPQTACLLHSKLWPGILGQRIVDWPSTFCWRRFLTNIIVMTFMMLVKSSRKKNTLSKLMTMIWPTYDRDLIRYSWSKLWVWLYWNDLQKSRAFREELVKSIFVSLKKNKYTNPAYRHSYFRKQKLMAPPSATMFLIKKAQISNLLGAKPLNGNRNKTTKAVQTLRRLHIGEGPNTLKKSHPYRNILKNWPPTGISLKIMAQSNLLQFNVFDHRKLIYWPLCQMFCQNIWNTKCCGQLWVWHMFCRVGLWWAKAPNKIHGSYWNTIWVSILWTFVHLSGSVSGSHMS